VERQPLALGAERVAHDDPVTVELNSLVM
jgi:hypothetical protein